MLCQQIDVSLCNKVSHKLHPHVCSTIKNNNECINLEDWVLASIKQSSVIIFLGCLLYLCQNWMARSDGIHQFCCLWANLLPLQGRVILIRHSSQFGGVDTFHSLREHSFFWEGRVGQRNPYEHECKISQPSRHIFFLKKMWPYTGKQ